MGEYDYTLETLLDMDGLIIDVGREYWVKIEAKLISINSARPFGVKYSLTMHDPEGNRILGCDNAHQVPGKKFDSQYDHQHKNERIISYDYHDAEKLLIDFWCDVRKIVEKGLH